LKFESQLPLDINEVGLFCKAAGDPLRIQILKLLQQNAYGVLELSQVLNVRQSAMSHHLKVLSKADLVDTRREGTTIYYRRNLKHPDANLHNLHCALFQTIDNAKLAQSLSDCIAEINWERAKASVEFFNRNVEHFEENQDLIASWTNYGDSVESFLDNCINATGKALEIGPGYGQFLDKLARTFKWVVALDNSSEMLDQCRLHSERQGLKNVHFVLGDTQLANRQGLTADCVSLNMVLHHTPAPARVIGDCAKLLNNNGVLLITDLCAHDQEWVKEACGDLWLGFDPQEITYWAQTSGLTEGNSLYISQRNGFRIQLRQFLLT
jgi:ArsR family transcriptional regulator